MRKLLIAAILSVGVGFAALPVLADPLPTIDQIYQAEEAGHHDQAQQMISQVLKERPDSAKAHFVQSELFAKAGYLSQARAELSAAERLDPSEKFAKPQALTELKSQLGVGRRTSAPQAMTVPARAEVHFPWGTVLILAVVVGILVLLFRRRSYPQYPAAGGPGVGGAPGYGPPGGGGYGPGYGPAPGGGIGSGIAGGLASGLAVGAGVVAGEELAHHFLDGGSRREGGGIVPSADAAQPDANSDMGGNDFGVNDPGSWDDGGGGGGGGDDWS